MKTGSIVSWVCGCTYLTTVLPVLIGHGSVSTCHHDHKTFHPLVKETGLTEV